jgi:hypothetical protein
MYMTGVARWSAVNVSYTPYDSLRTIEAQGACEPQPGFLLEQAKHPCHPHAIRSSWLVELAEVDRLQTCCGFLFWVVAGVPMVACDDSHYMSCQLGQACSYGVSSLYCSPCQPNLASDDGFQCQLCLPGRGPSVKQDACVQCEAGLYSSHGTFL